MNPSPRFQPVKAPKNPAVRWYTAQACFPDAVPFGDDKLTLPCPGVHQHGSHTGVFRPGDCVIRFDEEYDLPILTCAHSSCKDPRSDLICDAQKTLNRAIWVAEMKAAGLWKDVLSGNPLRKKAGRIMGATAKRLDLRAILKTAEEKKAEEKLAGLAARALITEPLPGNVDPAMLRGDQTRAHVDALYRPDDYIWLGTEKLGKPTQVSYIKTLLEMDVPLFPFIGMSTYGRESVRRLDTEIKTSPWIVLEADSPVGDISARDWAMRLAACLLQEGIPPRCVIDSGGKSAHVWLDRAAYLARYAAGLSDKSRNTLHKTILKVDQNVLRIGQLVRLAGAQGEGRIRPAALLYLQP